MSNLIQFLEQLGGDARLAHAGDTEYLAAVESASLDDAPKQALRNRDADALNDLAGGRLRMMCILFPAEGDDEKKDDQPDDGTEPDGDDSRESIHFSGRH